MGRKLIWRWSGLYVSVVVVVSRFLRSLRGRFVIQVFVWFVSIFCVFCSVPLAVRQEATPTRSFGVGWAEFFFVSGVSLPTYSGFFVVFGSFLFSGIPFGGVHFPTWGGRGKNYWYEFCFHTAEKHERPTRRLWNERLPDKQKKIVTYAPDIFF